MKLKGSSQKPQEKAASDLVDLLKTRPDFCVRRIAVPVDFSDNCKKAVQYAVALARQYGAKLVLIHAIEPYVFAPEVPVVTPELSQILQKEARDLLGLWANAIKDVPFQTIVANGDPAREIVREAKKAGADLIVISTHGRTGLAHMFMGSVAEKVVRWADCPVTVVRPRERDYLSPEADVCERNQTRGSHEEREEMASAATI